MVEKIEVSGGVSRSEMLLALKKAEITMKDENLYTGDENIDKQTKAKLALVLARQG